jgi:hypothetical protein
MQNGLREWRPKAQVESAKERQMCKRGRELLPQFPCVAGYDDRHHYYFRCFAAWS